MTREELKQVAGGTYEVTTKPGLVSIIISLIMHGQGNSVSASWMCASLEAFLRGADPRVHWWMTGSGLTKVCSHMTLDDEI